nr:uncharacterized protein LOC109179290 [Ipomoea trifida]GLL44974.1 uncharacterized protein LOC109179290 [Ipomoea trifida]
MQAKYSENNYGSSSSNSMFQHGEVISNMRCHCGEVLKLRTSWTNDNPGRRYWDCGRIQVSGEKLVERLPLAL